MIKFSALALDFMCHYINNIEENNVNCELKLMPNYKS